MKRRNRQAGFTLVEILMVLVIVGIAAAVAVPSFARSFRGARVRNSTRTILMAHRHAQAKAVLGQRHVAILFDARKHTVEVVEQGQSGAKKDAFFGTVGGAPAGGVMGAMVSGGAAPPEPEAPPASVLARKLEEGVRILAFRGGSEIDEIHYVSYFPNGTSQPYEIRIGDDENRSVRIAVDAVTGRPKVTRD